MPFSQRSGQSCGDVYQIGGSSGGAARWEGNDPCREDRRDSIVDSGALICARLLMEIGISPNGKNPAIAGQRRCSPGDLQIWPEKCAIR